MMNRKTCTVFLVLLAGVVALLLSACGGGGKTQSVPSTGDEMIITPPIDETALPSGDYANTPEGATVVVSGQTINGSLDSPDDVDYFRLELTEPGILFSTLTADTGLEIAIVDGDGNVLTTAVTASDGTTGVATEEPTLWVRVKDTAKDTAKVGEELAKLKRYRTQIRFVPYLRLLNTAITVIESINGVREIVSEITREVPNACAAPEEVSREQITPIVIKKIEALVISTADLGGGALGTVLGGLVGGLFGGGVGGVVGGQIGLVVGEGFVSLVRPVIEPKIERIITETLRELNEFRCLREIKPLTVSVDQGGEAMIRLTDYIEDPDGGALTFTHGSLPAGFGVTKDGADWTIATQSTVEPDEYTITVTATNAANQSQDFPLQVTVTGEDFEVGWSRARNVDCHIKFIKISSRSFRFRHFTYSGECRERKAHGQGIVVDYGNNNHNRFEGEWRDGAFHGQGTFTGYWPDGGPIREHWEGEWRDGALHGQGTFTTYRNDGSISRHVEGEWRDGALHEGTVTIYRNDGSISSHEEGEWRDGDLHGQGTLTTYHNDGSISSHREGEWRDGDLHGQGTFTTYRNDGSISGHWEGEWRIIVNPFGHLVSRLWNGTHTAYWPNGDVDFVEKLCAGKLCE